VFSNFRTAAYLRPVLSQIETPRAALRAQVGGSEPLYLGLCQEPRLSRLLGPGDLAPVPAMSPCAYFGVRNVL